MRVDGDFFERLVDDVGDRLDSNFVERQVDDVGERK